MPEFETIPQPNFIVNSVAADPQSNSLLAAGMASINPSASQTYDAEELFQFTPAISYAPVPYSWPPITVSLDVPDRAFYITDFDGNLSDPSSNATMVTGMDGVTVGNNTLTSVAIPVFGSGAAPASPHVFDIEPDTSSYQAWISGSDATDGGFVRLWDSSTQAVTLSAAIPASGGGHLFVDSASHAAYLLDHVNGQLWLINKPQWTGTAAPLLTQAPGGASVSITVPNSADTIYYTLDTSPPGPGLSPTTISCTSPCAVTLSTGIFIVVSAIDVDSSSGTPIASNVAQDVFTKPAPTSLAVSVSPNPALTGNTLTATATLTTSSSNFTGTGAFTAAFNGSTATLCSGVKFRNVSASWQATCTFVENTAGSYSINSTFTGDSTDLPSTSNSFTLQVNQNPVPPPGVVSGSGNALAINANQPPGIPYNAVLNMDSSISFVQDGSLLSGQSCPAFSGISGSVNAGAIYLDAANKTVYLALMYNSALYAAYEIYSLNGNTCTQGPLLQIASGFTKFEMNVDPVQGNVYILSALGGGVPDSLYVAPTAPWSASALPTPATLTTDYSAQYGSIVIDSSTHRVYIDDFGASSGPNPGTFATSGFFVYDPNHSATPANNLQWVSGYINSGGIVTPFNVGTLLTDNQGKVILVNENPSALTTNLTTPITILDTTKFSFFSGTQSATSPKGSVDITPSAGLSTISATAQYSAIGAADINTASGLVYTSAFNTSTRTGELIQDSLSGTETVLNSSIAMPVEYSSEKPWAQLNYDPESTEMALSSGTSGSGALGVVTPLCAGNPVVVQVLGSQTAPTSLIAPVVNADSGYIYAIQQGYTYPPPGVLAGIYYVAPAPACSSLTPLSITTASLTAGIVGNPYSQTLTATGGSGTGYSWTVTSGTALSAVGLTLSPAGVISGTPTVSEAAVSVTIQVTDSSGNSASQTYQVTIYPALAIAPATLPLGVVGHSYTQTLTATGGSGSGYQWGVTSGTALSAVGLALSSAGVISGTPTTSETSEPVTVDVADSLGNVTTMTYKLTIDPALSIPPTALTAGVVGQAYSQQLSAEGGSGTGYTWSITAGQSTLTTLGLSLSGAGLISGTPSEAGQANITAQVTDSLGDTATQNYLLTVGKANVTITGPATQPVRIQSGTAGSIAVSLAPQSSGSGIATPTGGLSYSVSGNAFGPGSILLVNGAGTIPVTSTVAVGTYTVAVSYAGDANYNATSITIQLITYQPILITSATLPGGTVGSPYSDTLAAAGGSGSGYTWTVSSGTALSAVGLTLSPAGVISGTPTASETAVSVAIQVTDSSGDTATQSYTLTISNSSSGPININDPETITVNDSNTQVQLFSVSDPETIAVTDIPVVTVQATGSLALSGQSQITYGQTETVTANVTAPGSATPTGSVTFSLGSTTLGTVNLNNAGIATYTTTTLPVGADTINAVYDPSGSIVSSATANFSVQVGQAGTTTVLNESADPAAGYITTFTATVTPATSGTPTGTVTFYDGTTAMGTGTLSGGVASFATNTLPGGSDTFTATYSGDADYIGSTSNALASLVADFAIKFSAPIGILRPGHTATFTMTVTPTNGSYNNPVSFSVSGLPTGATATFSPTSVTPGSHPVTAKLTITAPQASAETDPGSLFRSAGSVLALLLPVAAFYRKRRLWRNLLFIAVAALGLGTVCGLTGCLPGFHIHETYTVTVTGTSGAVQNSTTLKLTEE